ncbi:unnamed protein product [[Candida] boidinii]|uniref:Unnamed protein product n=1 Tax=Candida boidinii TaxID=5477 RepID=A0ACB5U4L0_CANBO|nr:unnamed protein product [[Candida] boidinii]
MSHLKAIQQQQLQQQQQQSLSRSQSQQHTDSNSETQGQENPFPNLIGNNRRPTNSSRSSEPSRNIILTVNYIYGRPETSNNTNTVGGAITEPVVPIDQNADQSISNSDATSNPNNQNTVTPTFDGIGSNTTDNNTNQINNISNLSGSLILHVPNIDDSDDDSLQVLVRLATTIALRTIATSVKKISGVNDDHFARLKTKNANELSESDRYCPICYDPYQEIDKLEVKQDDEDEEVEDVDDEDEDKDDIDSNKRKKLNTKDEEISDNPESKETSPRKRRKINSDSRYKTSENGSTRDTIKDNNFNKNDKSEYTHVPVLMPCGHVFGRSCLREWLKTNNSCPLCRLSIPIPRSESNDTNSETTIILPNLARVISEKTIQKLKQIIT